MLNYGIVCEFNPFHSGHKYLINKTRENTGADGIICVMSGSMVQRGDVAIFDKWTRAKSAVENGADLVVELPVSYVLQSADIFAYGAVSILNALNADGISFGTECDNTDMLKKVAQIKNCEPETYKKAFKEAMDTGRGYPHACEAGLKAYLGEIPPELTMPNSTLAAAYISAAMKINENMKINAVKRIGSYHSTDSNADYPSAAAIRKMIFEGDINEFEQYKCCNIYDINKISSLILGFLRMSCAEKLSKITGMENGLAERMIKAAKASSNLNEFINRCVSKRYTTHRIRRAVLASLLDIEEIAPPGYIRILALNSTGAKIIKNAKQNSNIDIITKISKTNVKNSKMLSQDIMSTDIAALCAGKPASMDFTISPVII